MPPIPKKYAEVASASSAPTPATDADLVRVVSDTRPACKACRGYGRASNNTPCVPCAGTGRQGAAKDPPTPSPRRARPRADEPSLFS